ncbi:hypothetical protein [Paludibacterium purpuratum]|uniref:Methyltransferase family protein n=1 Tax=Paludibacterium purpuratum TaxID=1144873 RepID=A0A4R7BCY6_9NEIS|nr:hypothetical protein [Paludibacterium purpuratum]TDR82022.1 hypothetical protein DFP86_102134 [Paludibacterium purpuratum]
MALLVTELRVLEYFIQRIKDEKQRQPRVLALGYPTFLALPEYFTELGISVDWRGVKQLANSAGTWQGHGWHDVADQPMLETRSLFENLGCEFVAVDAITWGGEDFILDLNLPIDEATLTALGKFDLILDPGTVEHCFNVAQVFHSIDQLLDEGGFVFHQVAVAFPNHGHWNMSPIALFAFYHHRQYALGQPYVWSGSLYPRIPVFHRIHPGGLFTGYPAPLIGALSFRKTVHQTTDCGFPSLQGIQSVINELPLEDWCRTALPATHCVD